MPQKYTGDDIEMRILLDLALIGIIILCVWNGYKKGLMMGIGGIVVILISVVVGGMLSNAYSQEVIPAMRPFASGYIDKLLTEGVYDSLGIEESEYSIDDLLKQNPSIARKATQHALSELGVYTESAELIADESIKYSVETGAKLTESVTEIVCRKVAFVVGFVLFFLLCLIILTVIGNVTNLSFRIPYFGVGNEIGGAVLGLVEGIIFCMIIAWTLRFAGIVFPDGLLDKLWLTSFFMDKNLLASYLGI